MATAVVLVTFSSPLSVVFHVLRTHDASTIYAPLTLTIMTNTLMWTICTLCLCSELTSLR